MDSNPNSPLFQPFTDDKNESFAVKNGDDGPGNGVKGSIAERRAAKFGFKAERISTPRFRTTSPLNSPAATGVRSPCITIPPGISPTALLDSPVMLPNPQPSPTTGTFPLPHLSYGGSTMLNPVNPADEDTDNKSDAFKFQPHTGSFGGFPMLDHQGQENGADFQAVDFEFPVDLPKEATTENNRVISSTDHNDLQMGIDATENQTPQQIEPSNVENIGAHHPLREEKGTFPTTVTGRNSEDGYNWRKYGQKQVKGSEYPRSYYKCTQPNCEVKKKIERSYDGQITEIIYKGTHNHQKPQPSRRTVVGSSSSCDEIEENSCHSARGEVGSVWKSLNPHFERASSASVVTDLSDPLSTTQEKSMGMFDSSGTPDPDDGATQGSISLGADDDEVADEEESESKRRRLENCVIETSLASRAVREPRVVVQIESEIDILDDGYRWRKYGQKVVKGNPNPRSYYKCTSAGCIVRKHVERASHNLKYVITTYEGKHNHEVPAARNSSHNNSSHVPNNSQPALTLARNANGPKPEKPVLDYSAGFDRKPMVNHEYLRPAFTGTSSNCPLNFPAFQHTMPYGTFGLNQSAIQQSGSIAALVPDFAFSMPPNVPLPGNGFGYNANVVARDQQFIPGQQLVRPKQEQREENAYDAGQSMVDRVNASQSSSLYHHMMGNFPS